MQKIKEKYRLPLLGIALGIGYGIITRLLIGEQANLASLSFLFLTPTILGMIPLTLMDQEKLESYKRIIFTPWITVFSFFLTLFLVGLEDFLCLLILGAPFFILGTLGSLIYRFGQINKKKNKGKLLSIVLLPLLLSPIETYLDVPSKIYTVKNEAIIEASPEAIWTNIVEVKTIEPHEYRPGFFNHIGIPSPINAKVDKKEIGGKRIGNFEGGLTFVETITAYQEYKRVAFDIQVAPQTVRQRVFDQHVLKGKYFTFVDASYELEGMENGKTKLSLYSNYQLSSTVNFYGHFWGDIILSDFQSRLLEVIKARSESH